MDISKIDKNFAVQTADDNGFVYYDVTEYPFSLEGMPFFTENGGAYYRLPLSFTEKDVNRGARELGWNTAGVHVRFRSNTPEIIIHARLHRSADMNHMPRAGSAGFDSYYRVPGKKMLYNKTLQPNAGVSEVKSPCGINDTGKVCDWIINFPLYGGVTQVLIGIKQGSILLPPKPHKVEKPVLFYGSSITQGGCASRPGNSYTAMLCRAVDAPEINWGFSGSGKGETAIAQAIGKLDLGAFVMDYDHNAPTNEHLQATHETFFRTVRELNPDLPIIIMSRCDLRYNDKKQQENDRIRRDIIYQTYRNAVSRGDKKVWFIDGKKLFGTDSRDACTVDGCHPNDLGFYRMYKAVLPTLKKALEL